MGFFLEVAVEIVIEIIARMVGLFFGDKKQV